MIKIRLPFIDGESTIFLILMIDMYLLQCCTTVHVEAVTFPIVQVPPPSPPPHAN